MDKQKYSERGFIDYLLSQGFEIWDNRWWESKTKENKWVKLDAMPSHWSMYNRTDVWFVRGDDFKNKIKWGYSCGIVLRPTCTLRLPQCHTAEDFIGDEIMPYIFQNHSPERIFEAMFDNTKRFDGYAIRAEIKEIKKNRQKHV